MFAERSGTGIFGGSGSSRAMRYKSNVKRDPRDGDDKGGYSSSDDSDGPKMDVEYISLLDAASDDDEMDGEERDMTNDWGAGAPVRIPRSEHVDRQAMVNTDSSAKKGKAELKAMKDKEMTFETEIKIKAEPEDDDLGMLPPSSPEMTKRKVKVSDSPEVKRKKEPTSPVRRRRRSSVLGKKPIISTTEEKEEYERLETDRNDALLELGGAMNGLGLDTGKARDPDNDVEMFSVCLTIVCFASTVLTSNSPLPPHNQLPMLKPKIRSSVFNSLLSSRVSLTSIWKKRNLNPKKPKKTTPSRMSKFNPAPSPPANSLHRIKRCSKRALPNSRHHHLPGLSENSVCIRAVASRCSGAPATMTMVRARSKWKLTVARTAASYRN